MKKCIVCLVSGLMVFGAMVSVGFAQETQETEAAKVSKKKKSDGKKKKDQKRSLDPDDDGNVMDDVGEIGLNLLEGHPKKKQ